jgi:thymidylate kinase
MEDWIDITTLRHVEKYAATTLQQYRILTRTAISLPIPIEEIADRVFGRQVVRCDLANLRPHVGGILTGKHILVDEQDHIHYQRFSIAHELGHMIVRHLSAEGAADESSTNGKLTALGFPVGSRGEEEFCDRYAKALLIPLESLEQTIAPYGQFDALTLSAVTRAYLISREAMSRRIIELVNDNKIHLRFHIDYESLDLLATILQKEKNTIRLSRCLNRQTQPPQCLAAPTYFRGSNHFENPLMESAELTVEDEDPNRPKYPGVPLIRPDDKQDRPYVIEFAGMPRAGKSTQIGLLAEYCRNVRGHLVEVQSEPYDSLRGEDLHPTIKSLLASFDRTISGLLRLYGDSACDEKFMKRALFDNIAYFNFHQELGYLTKRDIQLYSNIMRHRVWARFEDVIVLLMVEPEVAIEREMRRTEILNAAARKYEAGALVKPPHVVNREGLKLLKRCYMAALDKYGSDFRRVVLINDDGNLSIQEVFEKILGSIVPDLPPSKNPAAHEAFTAKLFRSQNHHHDELLQLDLFGSESQAYR